MAKNRPSGKKSLEVAPPTSRRSARQERLTHRDPTKSLSRASTSGGAGQRPILLITGLVAIVAVVLVAVSYMATQPKAITDQLVVPGIITPSGIPTDGRTLGNANAPATLELLSDFRCTGCFQFAADREPQLVENYVKNGKLKIVYKDFLTIDGGQRNTASRDAANAAWCAADQNKFWPMHDWLFANADPIAESPAAFAQDRLLAMGKVAGLDTTTFNPCVQNGSHFADIAAESVPRDASFTPYTYLNGKAMVGPVDSNGNPSPASYAQLAAAIDAIVNGSSASPSASSASSASASSAGPSPSAS